MKPENVALAGELAVVTDNLTFGYDGRISPFIWEIEEKGAWSAYNLVMQNKVWGNPSLKVCNFEEYSQGANNKAEKDKAQALYEILKFHLEDFEFYVAYYSDDSFYIHVGKTSDGDWIGIGTEFDFDPHASLIGHYETSESCQFKKALPSSAALQVISNLEQAGFSEAKVPVWHIDYLRLDKKKKYIYCVSQQKEELVERILIASRFLAIRELGEGIDALGNEFAVCEDDPQKDYKQLDRLLKSRLTNLRIYMVGLPSSGEFDIYALGNTSTGDYAGVLIDVE